MFGFGHPVAVGRLTIHSLEDVGAGIAAAAAAVHTRRLKAKSCNFSSYLSPREESEIGFARHEREGERVIHAAQRVFWDFANQ